MKKTYIKNIIRLMKKCDDVELIDLIKKLLEKGVRNDER
jgi:hypothetical protein